MNWIERYVNAVTQRLPKAKREDIGAELDSILHEKIEEKESSLGRPLEESEVLAELKAYGHPLRIAARYQDQQVLIGEALFPIYAQMMKFMVLVVLAAFFISWTISASSAVPWWPDNIGAFLELAALRYAVAITIAFHLVERYHARIDFFTRWNPSRLSVVQTGASRISVGETAFYLACYIVAFAVVSAIDDRFSIASFVSAEDPRLQFISLAKVLLVGTIGLFLSLLFNPHWTRGRLVVCAALAFLMSYIGYLGWRGWEHVIERATAEGSEGAEFLVHALWIPFSFVIAGVAEAAWCAYRFARIRVV